MRDPCGGAAVFGIAVDKIDFHRMRQNKTFAKFPDWALRLLDRVMGGDPSPAFLCPGLLRHLRARGVPSWFLGVNTEAHVRVCHRVGGCAVLTDSPMWLA